MDLSNIRIVICGPRSSGKSTFTVALRNALGCCAYFDIGDALIDSLAEVLGAGDVERMRERRSHILRFKDDYRSDLIALGNVLRRFEPAILIHHGFSKAPIVCGVRTKDELKAYANRDHKYGRTEILLELHRPGCPTDNFELAGVADWGADYFSVTMKIPNLGTPEELRDQANGVADFVRKLVAKP
jgi:hypothetical protein